MAIDFLIFFEGIDKVGKSTLIAEFHKKTNYKYIVVDRGPISFITYNKMKNRNHDIAYHFEKIKALYVCLYADLPDLINRFKEHNETDIPIVDIEGYLNTFITEMNDYVVPKNGSKKITINTSKYTVQETVDIILTETAKMEA